MLRVFLDAHVLAMPQGSAEPVRAAIDSFETYVIRLLELNDARRAGFGHMYLPRDVEEVLFATGLYPLWNGLASALTAANLQETYQPQDIVSVVDGLLKQLPRLEDALHIDTLLAEPADLEPDNYLGRYPQPLAISHRELLLLVCVLFRCTGRSPGGDFVMSHGMETGTRTVKVSGRIEDWALLDAEPCGRLGIPLDVRDEVALVTRWSDVLQAVDPIEIWRAADSVQECQVAFRRFLWSFAEVNCLGPTIVSRACWSFGASFLGTLESLGFRRDGPKIRRLFSAMAETALRRNLHQVHQIRTGEAGNDPQVKRGEDGAWRRDIDHEFHLHFWSTSVGTEFAAVVVHNDFSIPR